jgi:hypothetical protein
MYFGMKSYLKSTHNYIAKHAISHVWREANKVADLGSERG